MKIEKINDRQIRCVLTKEDLETRKIRLSELVCGGEKARGLLRDMVIRAARELNFSFNNNPLMIEAVPSGKDQLVLIITRVDDPKELDSRFKQFSGLGEKAKKDPGKKESDQGASLSLSGADDILNLLRKFTKRLEEGRSALAKEKADASGQGEGRMAASGQGDGRMAVPGPVDDRMAVPGQGDGRMDVPGPEDGRLAVPGQGDGRTAASGQGDGRMAVPGQDEGRTGVPGQGEVRVDAPGRGDGKAAGADLASDRLQKSPEALEEDLFRYTRFYLFRSLENVLSASKRVPETYSGENTLYKNPDDGAFYLLIRKMNTDPEQFNRICNVLSEYSMPMDYSSGMDEFFREHMKVIVADNAMQSLRGV